MFSKLLIPLALTASVLAHAAPPNPDQLFALQEAAASKASVASVSSEATSTPAAAAKHHGSKHAHGREKRGDDWSALKRHQHGQQMHGAGMQKKWIAKRGGAQRLTKQEDVREKRRRDSGLDSSEVNEEDESDLEARGTQYTLYEGSNTWSADSNTWSAAASSSGSAKASATSSSKAATSTTSATTSDLSGDWHGASSYYLFALADTERYAVLDALKDGGFKVVRIFVSYVGANNKGSNSVEVNDMEPKEVGTYDDTILEKIDQLMYDCQQRGLKLMIALADRYALGFWSTDAYALQLNIVKAGSSGVQQIANAGAFYTNSWAATAMDNRYKHALSHKNTKLGGKTWAELDDVIYAFEPQNEPQGHMDSVSSTWACDRAATIKSLLPSGSSILVGSGGGITTTLSLGAWATTCDSIDIVSVHDYGTDAQTTANALVAAKSGSASGKIVMMGEWGITGSNKASTISQFVAAFKAAGLPWMYWEIVKPGKAASDFEVWTDEPAWAALTGGTYTEVASSSSTTWSPAASTTWSKAASTTAQWSSSTASWSKAAASSSSEWQASSTKASWTPSSSSSSAEWTPASSTKSRKDWQTAN
ncbi:glycoside hydrolase superfamily [Leucosporidium creatinivorum]|uniref:Glycoside hydrolase superfamily n=1 Tax=Leucosporidium creatinivorum TaxID=106004 RepID=A0A1Y2FVX1_9BASI|nr:glycoside hydrolase superfamily [Leucosporidium creatinivorum]